MPKAYILINTHPNKEDEIVRHLKETPHVSSADILFGYYDVIAAVDAPHVNNIGTVIDEVRKKTTGIIKTSTMIVKDDYFTAAAR